MKSLFLPVFLISTVLLTGQSRRLSPSDAVNLARQQNISLVRDSLERDNISRNLRWQGRQFLPSLEFGYSGNDSVTAGGSDSRIKKLSLGVEQLLFDGGRELVSFRNARRDLELRNLEAAGLASSIVSQVLLAYVNVLKYRKILKIRNMASKILLDQLKIAEMQLKQGEINRLDYREILLNTQKFHLSLREASQDYQESRYKLAGLLYIPFEQLPELTGRFNADFRGTLVEKAEEEAFLSGMRAKALECNRDLQKLAFQEKQAGQQLKESRFYWIPSIEATADFSFSGQEYPLNEPAFSLGLNFQFQLPVFPTSFDLQAGQTHPDEYNRAITSSTGIMENMEGLQDIRIARNSLILLQMESENQRRDLDFQILSLGERILISGRTIRIKREELAIMEERLSIQNVRLQLGEITRGEAVDAEIEFAEEKVALIENLVNLYGQEEEMKTLCGINRQSFSEEELINEE